MNDFQIMNLLQKPLHLGFKATGYIATGCLAAMLIVAWILTTPIFHLSVFLSDLSRTRITQK